MDFGRNTAAREPTGNRRSHLCTKRNGHRPGWREPASSWEMLRTIAPAGNRLRVGAGDLHSDHRARS
jgi:hypothetical protein